MGVNGMQIGSQSVLVARPASHQTKQLPGGTNNQRISNS